MKQFLQRLGLLLLATFSLTTVVLGSFPAKVFAAGETYTWKDNNTITVSGGDLKNSVDFKLVQGTNPERFSNQSATSLQHESGCVLGLDITLSSDSSAVTRSGLPNPNTPPVTKPGEHSCSEWNASTNAPSYPGVSEGYNNKTITIGGTRSGGQSESELDKSVFVVIKAPNVSSASPASITITIKDAAGKVVAAREVPQEPSIGSDDPNSSTYIPPESRPIDYSNNFVLNPGKYIVCADIVIKDCKAFEKVKFKSLTLTYGETSIERSIKIVVESTYIGNPRDMTMGPLQVTIRRPDQSVFSVNTDEVSHVMTEAEKQADGLISVTYTMTLRAEYKDADPGTYEVCLVGLSECKDVIKQAGSNAQVNFKIDWNAYTNDNTVEDQCKDKYDVMGVKAATYLVCSIIGTATYAVGAMDSVISGLLTINVDDIFSDTNGNNPYHIAWNSFRYFALGLLVVAALVMVVSQAAGLDFVDAYMLRKLLPRLLFAAVFIAISWDVLEFLTQLSNDAGTGIRSLIYAPFKAVNDGGDIGGGSIFVLTLIGTGGALAFGWLGLLSFVLTGLLASLVAVSILVLRKVVILLLVMFAPFAIASSVLPNTRKIWDIWVNTLQGVLIVFPIIMAFIAIGRVFAITSFNAPGNATINQLIAVVAYFGPYFLITVAFRLAGGAMAVASGAINNRSRGAFDRIKNYRSGKAKENLTNMKQGNRFADSNFLARGFNTASQGVGTGWKGRFGVGGRGAEARDQVVRTGAGNIAESAEFRNLSENTLALEAATYGSQNDAIAGLMARGHSEEDARRATNGVQTSIGFGRSQQFAAAQQMSMNGRAFDDVEHEAQTLARASGGNRSTMAGLAGFANFDAKQRGRHDLAPGFGRLFDAVQREAGLNGGFASNAERDAYYHGDEGVQEAAWNSGDPVSLISNKTPAFRNMLGHWQQQYQTAQTEHQDAVTRGDRDAQEDALRRGQKAERAFFEMEQSRMYGGGENVQALTEVIQQIQPQRTWLGDTAQTGIPPNMPIRSEHRQGDQRVQQDPNQVYQQLNYPNYIEAAHAGARMPRLRDLNME